MVQAVPPEYYTLVMSHVSSPQEILLLYAEFYYCKTGANKYNARMSLFTLDIADILAWPVGTMQEFHFKQTIPEDTFSEVTCQDDLVMDIKIVHQSYGVECIFISLETTIDIPSESIEWKEISLNNQSREFHTKRLSDDADDIQYIDMHELTVDLTQAIEEELLIAGL